MVACGRKVAADISSVVNTRVECVRVLHEALLMPVVLFGS